VPSSRSLFSPDLPSGFEYREDFIDAAEEARLLDEIARVEFSAFEMHGVAARRRVAFFGQSYDAGSAETPPIPSFLSPLRTKLAAWAGVPDEAFAMALINDYPPGAPIGWHRDAQQYDRIAGLSLLSACRMKLRPYLSPNAPRPGGRRTATHEIELARRSAYLIAGAARSEFEHHIPAVGAQRYSITFRTLRERGYSAFFM
jgi:alkylated DNA repair dioxygenase AlkB